MKSYLFTKLFSEKKPIKIPEVEDSPITPSEKIVREEIRKLNESSEQLRKLGKEVRKQESAK